LSEHGCAGTDARGRRRCSVEQRRRRLHSDEWQGFPARSWGADLVQFLT